MSNDVELVSYEILREAILSEHKKMRDTQNFDDSFFDLNDQELSEIIYVLWQERYIDNIDGFKREVSRIISERTQKI